MERARRFQGRTLQARILRSSRLGSLQQSSILTRVDGAEDLWEVEERERERERERESEDNVLQLTLLTQGPKPRGQKNMCALKLGVERSEAVVLSGRSASTCV